MPTQQWGLYDTGCRAWLTGYGIDNLNDPRTWPTIEATRKARAALIERNPDHHRLQPSVLAQSPDRGQS